MLKVSFIALNVCISFMLAFTAGGGLALAASNNDQPVETNPSAVLVMKTQLKLEAVTSGSVCGTTLTAPEKRLCLGSNSNEIAANDTVGKLDRFILGAGNLCGIDERGIRCWATLGTFERPIQELLAIGDSANARFGNGKFCVPQADKTIRCYGAERGAWVATENGTDGRFVRNIPAVEIFGPYADLRDFRLRDSGICVLNGENISCETSKNDSPRFGSVPVPSATFKGARSITTSWGLICVLSDEGLDCFRGPDLDVKRFHVEGPWMTAVRLFDGGHESVCGIDKDEKPMCVKLGPDAGVTTDITPAEFTAPDIRVVKFRSAGGASCALVEKTSTGERTFWCDWFGKLAQIPLGKDAVDFEFSPNGTCVRNAAGIVSCFMSGTHLDSPLPEDGSRSHTAGKCRWNDSRFHCSSVVDTIDFSDVKTVLGATPVSGDLPLPCMIYENRGGLRKVRCFGSPDSLISSPPDLAVDNVKIVARFDYACAYGADQTECWGKPLGGVTPPNLSIAKRILFGDQFGCAKDQFGFVCWGRNLDTRLLEVPRALAEVDNVADFAVGSEHVCAITREQTIVCWGTNHEGQLDSPILTNPVSIGASGSTTCATSDEGVTCWGRRDEALLGKRQRGPRNNRENRE